MTNNDRGTYSPEGAPNSPGAPPAVPPDREIELKLACDAAAMTKLRRAAAVARLAQGKPVTKTLVSHYYDTEDLALKAAGLALRVRKVGRSYVQAVKTEGVKRGPATDRCEIETLLPANVPAPEQIPDDAIRGFIQTQAVTKGLRAAFATEIRRTTRELRTADGSLVEMAFDTGVVRTATREEPINEIELELKAGRPGALFDLAKTLSEIAPVRLDTRSKAARGFALAAGAEQTYKAVKASPITFTGGESAEEALCRVLSACLDQVIANEPVVRLARKEEGVHQLRVGLRRFRSALKLFRTPETRPVFEPLNAEARGIAAVLGAARDKDVVLAEILAPVEAAFPGHPGLAELAARIQAARADAWAEAIRMLESGRLTRFVLEAGAVIETRAWRDADPIFEPDAPAPGSLGDPVRSFADRDLSGVLGKAAKLGKKLSSLDEECRHDLRKRLKAVRYACEFFAELYPKKTVKPYVKTLSSLQEVFGGLNDVATARDMLAGLTGPDEAPKVAEAAGLVLGWHHHKADQDWLAAKERWRAFAKMDPFWG